MQQVCEQCGNEFFSGKRLDDNKIKCPYCGYPNPLRPNKKKKRGKR